MKEEFFIDLIKNILPESRDYIGDDTAYIHKKDLILTQDTLIEDVHFRMATTSAFDLGKKAIAVNLSDIAASGGEPAYCLISLSFPENTEESFVKEFYEGVKEICTKNEVHVVGGDLTKAEKINISICMIGFGNGLTPAGRNNATPGDCVIVTGKFGSSRAGLEILEKISSEEILKNPRLYNKFIHAHTVPVPRLKEGRVILRYAKTPALMDASDGLADALSKICRASNVDMLINFDDIPYEKDLTHIFKTEQDIFNCILFGGEDFELVGTVSEEIYEKLLELKTPVTKIGTVLEAENTPFPAVKYKDTVIRIDEKLLNKELFNHFKG